jgi:GLPGLI family protein
MKNQILLWGALLFTMMIVKGQDFEGVATYKSSVTMKLNEEDKSGPNAAMFESLQKQLAAQMQKEFTLSFNKDESFFKEIEKLEKPAASAGGITIVMSGGADATYRNTKENRFVQESTIMQKEFLIKDQLEEQDWKLEKETRNIGQYAAFKATKTFETTDDTWNSETKTLDKVTKEKTITVWYTPQIPVQHGPADYYGLPGLILQVEDGERTLLCSKIILNPKDGVIIKEPKNGKVVTQAKFDTIQETKMAEMRENFKGGSSIMIETVRQ